MLLYKVEFPPQRMEILISEKGSRRILYLDTLRTLAREEDKPALAFLTKIHLRSPNVSRASDTAPFQKISIPLDLSLEALRLLSKTGRLYYKDSCLEGDWLSFAKIYWKGEEESSSFAAVIQCKDLEIPIEQCDQVHKNWCLLGNRIYPIKTEVSWKWIEFFLQGKRTLQGSQKKQFFDELPPILWKPKPSLKPIEVFPELILTDATGCFANLWMEYPSIGRILYQDVSSSIQGVLRLKKEEQGWESDLLESGFHRKIVGSSHYYCNGDKVWETLHFLIGLGWKVKNHEGKQILRQTSCAWDVRNEKGKIAVEGKIHFQQGQVSLHSAMQAKGFWVPLEGGSIGLLDRKKLAALEGDWEGNCFVMPKSSLGVFSAVSAGDLVSWEEEIRKLADGLKEGASLENARLGETFRGSLLPYQQKGVDWLKFLQKWGFSGLLADEMGLGKTVQVLAFFSTIRTNLPILVVAPSSLLFQWKTEILRFLGDVPVFLHAGPDRRKSLVDIQGIIITSYAILRQDEELLSQLSFEVIVLDESNAIKTSTTQTAIAASRLQGHFKIALTGTPVENRPEELLSQFRFLMPDFHAPSLQQLRKQIRPFILRRKKMDVEIDLPEKMEQIVWVEMHPEQESLYQSYLLEARRDLLPKMEKEGVAVHRMEILEKILRLRQICADPRLVGSDIIGSKIEILLEDLQDRKVLIYSQFTSMLSLIGKALSERGLKFFYLDGSTSAEARQLQVKQFQEDPNPSIFLLSLKAGGVGLNLTAADYVLLFDPWWNEAVEAQAIDRAHRIGQKKAVIAKRYLTVHSIEEKMLRLKEKKREVAELLLEGEAFNWTEEDLLHLLT